MQTLIADPVQSHCYLRWPDVSLWDCTAFLFLLLITVSLVLQDMYLFFLFFFKVCLVLNVYKVKTPKRHKQFVDNHHESYHKENEVFVYSDKEFVFFDGYFSVLISKCDRHFPSLWLITVQQIIDQCAVSDLNTGYYSNTQNIFQRNWVTDTCITVQKDWD